MNPTTKLLSGIAGQLTGLKEGGSLIRFRNPAAGFVSANLLSPQGEVLNEIPLYGEYPRGVNEWRWDNVGKSGTVWPAGEYQVQFGSAPKFKAKWLRGIGNSSATQRRLQEYQGYNFVYDIEVVGNRLYMCTGYGEADSSLHYCYLSKPQTHYYATTDRLSVFKLRTDGKQLYIYALAMQGRENGEPVYKEFIYATEKDKPVIFANGEMVNTTEFHSGLYSSFGVRKTKEPTVVSFSVQSKGLAAIPRTSENVIEVFDMTGAQVGKIPVNNPVHIAFCGNDKLAVYDGKTTTLYNFAATGLTNPKAIYTGTVWELRYSGGKLNIGTDGGIVGGYNVDTGESTVIGKLGGYSTTLDVAPDRFAFEPNFCGTATQPDGQLWVLDRGNRRLQRFSPKGCTETIGYLNNITTIAAIDNRAFAAMLEFEIDSGKLVKNYTGVAAGYQYFTDCCKIGGRTYCYATKDYKAYEIVDITTGLAPTGLIFDYDRRSSLKPEGIYYSQQADVYGTYRHVFVPLAATDKGLVVGKEQVLVNAEQTENDPFPRSGVLSNYGETIDGNIFMFCNMPWPDKGPHFGLYDPKAKRWIWRTAFGTGTGYGGPYKLDGSFNNGNGTNYPGSVVVRFGDYVGFNMRGENFKEQQVNVFHIFHARTGLYIGWFGWTPEVQPNGDGAAGNAFNFVVLPRGKNWLFIHGDESRHGRIQCWEISGLDSFTTTTQPLSVVSYQQAVQAVELQMDTNFYGDASGDMWQVLRDTIAPNGYQAQFRSTVPGTEKEVVQAVPNPDFISVGYGKDGGGLSWFLYSFQGAAGSIQVRNEAGTVLVRIERKYGYGGLWCNDVAVEPVDLKYPVPFTLVHGDDGWTFSLQGAKAVTVPGEGGAATIGSYFSYTGGNQVGIYIGLYGVK